MGIAFSVNDILHDRVVIGMCYAAESGIIFFQLNDSYEPEATNITVEQTLEYRQGSNWYPVNNASWITSTHSATINYSNSKSDLSSGTYRVKSVFTFTNSKGETETVTEYSSEKTC